MISTKNRFIQSEIPAPGTFELIGQLSQTESRSMHGQLPIAWKRASDFNVYDIADNKFIDFTSSIFVANVGHSNPRVSSAIAQCSENDLYSCYAYVNELRADYLKELIAFSSPYFEKAFLLSAGTEATDAMLKLIRMHGQQKKKRRLGVITFEGNWHGRTMGAQLLSSNGAQKKWVGQVDENVHHLPFPYPWSLGNETGESFFQKSMDELEKQGINPKRDLAGVVLETFQGWAAMFYPDDFVKAVSKFCETNDLLLSFDEMQAGFGRTGKKFGFEHYDVNPDLIAVGKGMGGGVPLSGVLGRGEILDLPEIGNMSSTHSANPLVCAAGLAVIEELLTHNLVEECERKGNLMFKRMNDLHLKYPRAVSAPHGRGLIAALIFSDPKTGVASSEIASKICELSMKRGVLLVHTGRESIKFGPPLTISDDALIEGLEVLEQAVESVLS